MGESISTEHKSDHAEKLKERFAKALEEPGSLTIEQLASTWKAVAEAEKVEMETANTSKIARFEKLKFWVPIVVSLVGTGALVFTLIFQVFQFRENARLSKETAEDTQWREMLNRAKVTDGPEGVFAVTLLKSFFDSDRYGSQAREIATAILGHMGDESVFDMLFPDLIARTRWWNLKDVSIISKQLQEGFSLTGGQLQPLEKRREYLRTNGAPSGADQR